MVKLKFVYLISVAVMELFGFISGFVTKQGVKEYIQTVEKPFLTPPSFVFPVVWSILFALMGISIARILLKPKSLERTKAIVIFILQLFVNFAWTLIFFNAKQYKFSFIIILILIAFIIYMIYLFKKVDKISAKLQIPYLLWVCFAAYLNFMIMLLN